MSSIDPIIQQALKDLPQKPGVYLHQNKNKEVIYVGKAINLKSRVRQYFQESTHKTSLKTKVLASEIAFIDHIVTASEVDALFLEAELIKRYNPKYNILLKDDKSALYVRINMSDPFPNISYTRQPQNDNAKYIGPFYQAKPVYAAMKVIRRALPYSTHRTLPKKACLQNQIGLCPGPEVNAISSQKYKKQLKKIILILEGQRSTVTNKLQTQMLKFSNQQEFEKAATIRNQLRSLERLGIIHLSNLEPIGLDSAHLQLINILNLDPKTTKRIEGFDISHMGGKFNVASQVVFNNGLPLKKEYKKYKMNLAGNDDFAHMNEAISRRLSKKNIDAWGKPDLFLIDGGKGQLSSALKAIQLSQLNIPAFGLAKKQEQIVIAKNNSILQPNFNYLKETKRNYTADGDFYFINLSSKDPARLLIERIRNEAHRFAVNYHSLLKNRTSTDSQLTKIPGIGSSTAKKLLNTFGSVNNIKLASHEQIAGTIGNIKAKALKRVLK